MTENFIQYTNVFIPLAISVVGGMATYVTAVRVTQQRVLQLEKDIAVLQVTGREVRDMAVACKAILKEREPFVEAKSPVALTERGIGLLIDSGGEEFVDKNYDELMKALREKNPKTKYDIQENAKLIMQEKAEESCFNDLKEYLFAEGLEIKNLIAVMSVHFRDQVLAESDGMSKRLIR